MTTTPNLGLAYINSGVPQPEVTHNDAVRMLDALVQIVVQDRDLATPPGSPSDGQRWIVGASPTGAWTGHTNHVLAWQDGAWRAYVPQVGWLAYVVDEGLLLAWSGSAWADITSLVTSLQNLVLLGIGTTADSTNPLSAKLNNALFAAKTVAEGGDGNLHYKLSKESAAKTLSLLMQTNFSGRAEFGLTGDDDFHFKVSPDGSSWAEALTISRTNGGIRFLAAETDVASAATCDIGSAANLKVQITGTTTITSFGTAANALRFIRFAGALTLTHNATSLILPGAANITTAAGDTCLALSDASGNWRVFAYQRASGKAAVAPDFAPPGGRLTLTSGTAVTTADVTGATAVYYTPANGNQVPLYDGAKVVPTTFAELSLPLDSNSGHTGYQQSGKNHDLFVVNDGGTVRLGSGPTWNAGAGAGSDTARGTGAGSTELELKNGLWTNKNTITIRFGSASGNTISVAANQALYVGTMRTTADGVTEDSRVKRFLWNAYNQIPRPMFRTETAGTTWNYTTASFRQVNNNASNQLDCVIGLPGTRVFAEALSVMTNSTSSWRVFNVGVGLDSTTNSVTLGDYHTGDGNGGSGRATYRGCPGIGRHYFTWLELGGGSDTTTWYAPPASGNWGSGIAGELLG